MRIKRLKREAATIIILKRKGVSINIISEFLGRSRSFISRIIKNSGVFFQDLRKLPSRVKMLGALRVRKFIKKLAESWTAFLLGETERPP